MNAEPSMKERLLAARDSDVRVVPGGEAVPLHLTGVAE